MAISLDTTPDSITVLVNKTYGLPSNYVPKDLKIPQIPFSFPYYHEKRLLRYEAAKALEALQYAGKKEHIFLYGVSGYRSYQRQEKIYQEHLKQHGIEYTSMISAKPGHSEHQTGLAMDLSCRELNFELTADFGKTKEGIWLAKNCASFGFILRYPEGKSALTGYAYEPWHIRYVGIPVAAYLTKCNLIFEEYFQFCSESL